MYKFKHIKSLLLIVLTAYLLFGCTTNTNTINFSKYGIEPNTRDDASIAVKKLIAELKDKVDSVHTIVSFPKGEYHFYPDSAIIRTYFISNHDQDNPKHVGMALENLKNITIDGNGSTFIFHGRMIPFSIINAQNITLRNFSIDFELPAFRQLKVLQIDTAKHEVVAEIYPKGKHRIENNNQIVAVGEGYENRLNNAMPFREDRRLAYNRQDVDLNFSAIEEIGSDTLLLKGWSQSTLTTVGERFALRSYFRPTPGIFISGSKNMALQNIKVHYAEGMGLLAQLSEDIVLNEFSVCLKGDDDPRYFTTQADATHFSGCKGVILSENGLYEGMADDAINVHGTYLKITKKINNNTIQARYMHPQAWGFKWGDVGDTIQFVNANTMEIVDSKNTIKSIKPIDQPTIKGAKVFEITLTSPLSESFSEDEAYGIENLTWTAEVVFSNNIIRNNRARGALFSTSKRVICSNNTFDHTHGAAILLSGDCNGWFETGPTRDVIIKNNTFTNALTANYQFTNAIISIFPVIPNLEDQHQYFHKNITIENNTFDTFDRPILYAKSVDGLIFRDNVVQNNSEFEPFHWNKYPFYFQKVDNILIENNTFENGFDPQTDLKIEFSPNNTVTMK